MPDPIAQPFSQPQEVTVSSHATFIKKHVV